MILLLLVSLVVLIVGYAWHNSRYWKNRGINGPESRIFSGNLDDLKDMENSSMPFKLAEWTKKYGKVYGFQRGCRNVLVVSDQELATQIFRDQFENFHSRDINPLDGDPDKNPVVHVFASRGLRWKRLRTLTSLVFTTKSLKKIFPIITQCVDRMCENLDEDLQQTSVINFAQNLKEFTADVILRSAFGRSRDREFIREMVEAVVQSSAQLRTKLLYICWICPPLAPILNFINRLYTRGSNKFVGSFYGKTMNDIRAKKEAKDKNPDEPREPKDFIDLLVEAESDDVVLQDGSSYDKKNSHVEKQLTQGEIFGACIVFLVGGFNPTANSIAFTMYHLAKDQELQEKVRQEIKELCPDDEDLDYDSLSQLKYTDSIMKETLRLYPISSALTSRRCAHTTRIGGIEIEQGTDVIMDVVSMHRDKEIWGEDAEEYKPERWFNSNVGNFYGFGDGLRSCVAARFAQLEHKVALVKILQKYRIHEVEETKEAKQVVGLLLTPKSLKVKLEKI